MTVIHTEGGRGETGRMRRGEGWMKGLPMSGNIMYTLISQPNEAITNLVTLKSPLIVSSAKPASSSYISYIRRDW